mmetsp:Transcript_7689/g.16000  ORF Transcript_7689/g.16000 Transcript_7689/m.16000 type:complete len:290 (-) Transcript_7689:154-1023(-)
MGGHDHELVVHPSIRGGQMQGCYTPAQSPASGGRRFAHGIAHQRPVRRTGKHLRYHRVRPTPVRHVFVDLVRHDVHVVFLAQAHDRSQLRLRKDLARGVVRGVQDHYAGLRQRLLQLAVDKCPGRRRRVLPERHVHRLQVEEGALARIELVERLEDRDAIARTAEGAQGRGDRLRRTQRHGHARCRVDGGVTVDVAIMFRDGRPQVGSARGVGILVDVRPLREGDCGAPPGKFSDEPERGEVQDIRRVARECPPGQRGADLGGRRLVREALTQVDRAVQAGKAGHLPYD